MFGRRSDGYLIRKIDPIVALMPHIMSQRNDAMVQLEYEIDYGKLARYVVRKEQEGVKLTFMDVVIAAFVRTIAELPELNRFIINKRVYARNTLSVSFAVLRSNGENVSDVDENTTKCYFDPHDTIFDVARRMNEVIEEARKPDADNATMRIASALLKSPIARPAVSVLKWMDRHGMMPRFYVLRDEAGETLLAASSVWAVVDRQSRAMVNNEELGVHIDPVETGEEIRLPGAVKKLETTQEKRFRVPAEYLDENGHMNNTFYYSVAEDCLGRDARRDRLLEIGTEHVSEALCGEELLLRWTESEALGYVTGSFGDKPIFRMNLKYA